MPKSNCAPQKNIFFLKKIIKIHLKSFKIWFLIVPHPLKKIFKFSKNHLIVSPHERNRLLCRGGGGQIDRIL